MKLNEATPGFSGTITIIDGDTRFLSRITSIGLTQGCQIEIMQNEKNNRFYCSPVTHLSQ